MSTDYREQAPNNLRWYEQGRADQRRVDWPVGIACAIVVALWLVFGG